MISATVEAEEISPFCLGGDHRSIVEDYWIHVETELDKLPLPPSDIGERMSFAAGYALGRGLPLAAADCFGRFVVCNYLCRASEGKARAELLALNGKVIGGRSPELLRG